MVDAADVLMDCDASVFESVDAILMILPVILVLVDVGSPENLVLASDAVLPVDDCTVVVPLGLLGLVRLVEELLVSAWIASRAAWYFSVSMAITEVWVSTTSLAASLAVLTCKFEVNSF